jgi:hypothetical protein
MVTTQEYAKVHEHFAAALERGGLIATSMCRSPTDRFRRGLPANWS